MAQTQAGGGGIGGIDHTPLLRHRSLLCGLSLVMRPLVLCRCTQHPIIVGGKVCITRACTAVD